MKPEKIFDYIKEALPDESPEFYAGVMVATSMMNITEVQLQKLLAGHKKVLTPEQRKKYRQEYHKKTYVKKERQVRIAICQHCHKEFQTKSNSAKYCSNNHRPGTRERKRISKRFLLKAKPKWMSWFTISNFYAGCPKGWQVDHIIPLNHPDVCGLHVPWNLQYLSPEDNLKKSNTWDGTYDNNGWKGT